jgi:hypothetical protein
MTTENTVMTDEQFALDRAIKLWSAHYDKGSNHVNPLFFKRMGIVVPDHENIDCILKLAEIFKQHLKSNS